MVGYISQLCIPPTVTGITDFIPDLLFPLINFSSEIFVCGEIVLLTSTSMHFIFMIIDFYVLPKVTIGRSNDVTYTILSPMISRCHATILKQDDGSWTITDNKVK
jgi:hypothetical protein